MANIISLSRITKEDWYKYKDALYRNDLFVVELDASYQKGILHFTHELSLVFYLEDNQLQLIEGNEIGPEYSEFDSGDWK
ncbi:MAG: hypothetical protein KBT11_03650, partial [Treponema sp.]|nr:hypothetical protein [Candidatus Treponema equifaecale]